jgi:uncharacterized RDD family membrane protein YckC
MPVEKLIYAGFWIRMLAFVIDLAITATLAILFVISRSAQANPQETAWLYWMWVIVIGWPYFAVTESSNWQASPGKRLLGLRVSDLNGNRISFGRASIRYLLKASTYVIFYMSCVMIAATDDGQALHDMVARTVVLRA